MHNGEVRLTVLLLALLTTLPAQDFASLKAERMAAGRKFTEGPVWSKDGYLLYSDVPANQIIKVTPAGVTLMIWFAGTSL